MHNPECPCYRWCECVAGSSSPEVSSHVGCLLSLVILPRASDREGCCPIWPTREYLVHVVTPGIVESTSRMTLPPDGIQASSLSSLRQQKRKTGRDHACTFPVSLFSSSFMDVSSYLGLVHDSKELFGKNHCPIHTGMRVSESHFHVRTRSTSWFLGGTGSRSSCSSDSLN